MRKIFLFSLLLVSSLFMSCSKPKKETIKPIPINAQKPVIKDIPLFIEVPGHIEALQAVNIRPQASGLVTQILYQEGKLIHEGELMVTIDDRPYMADVRKFEAMVEENKAQLRYAVDTYHRNEPLVEEDFISKETFENLGTNVAVLSSAID